VAVAAGRAANVMFQALVVFNPTLFIHPQQRETPRRSARHLSSPYSQAGNLLPASCRRGGIRRALKDAPRCETAACVPFRHSDTVTDGWIVARPHYASVTVIPMGKPFDILPTKVQARLPRLSRAYPPAVSPFRLHNRCSSLFHSFTRGSKRGDAG